MSDELGAEIKARMPERTLIDIVSRTAYWLGWHRHFGPASGHDPKLKKPQDRYVLSTKRLSAARRCHRHAR